MANGNLPNLTFVRFPHDHFGNFGTAIDGVNTVETQMADNDYAVGLLIEKVAKSKYKDNTLIFVVEDDAQNGGDHVDAHRSIALIAGSFVRRGELVSRHYTTVSMIRTMVDVLGIESPGLNDALAEPMADIFNRDREPWTYTAACRPCSTAPSCRCRRRPWRSASRIRRRNVGTPSRPIRTAEYWDRVMAGQNFEREDDLDTERFNRALWAGLRGDGVPVSGDPPRQGHEEEPTAAHSAARLAPPANQQ